MAKILIKSRRYRFDNDTFSMLQKLKAENIIESRFVRDAIKQKFETDYPKIQADKVKFKIPF